MWRYGRGQERKVSILDAKEARARTVRVGGVARTRAGETAKRRRLAATDGRSAVICAGSRRAPRRFAPPVCANDNGERKVSILDAMEARARTVCEARARAGETVKRRRLAATDGTPADAAP